MDDDYGDDSPLGNDENDDNTSSLKKGDCHIIIIDISYIYLMHLFSIQ